MLFCNNTLIFKYEFLNILKLILMECMEYYGWLIKLFLDYDY